MDARDGTTSSSSQKGGLAHRKAHGKKRARSQAEEEAAEAAGEARAAVERAAAERRAQWEEAHRLEAEAFSSLPPDMYARRLRSHRKCFVECIDVERSYQLLRELNVARADKSLPEPHRREAQYLYNHLTSWMKLLHDEGLLRNASLPRSCGETVASTIVMSREYAYFSRGGGGRRYTTITRPKRGRGGRVLGYYDERVEGNARVQVASLREEKRYFGLQGCPKALRAQLCGAFAHDVDMRSAHPTIAQQLRQHLLDTETDEDVLTKLKAATLTHFDDYVQNRDTPHSGWIDRMSNHHAIEGLYEQRKDCIKRLFCRLMFGGSYRKWMTLPYGKDPDRLPASTPLSGVLAMESELKKLRTAVFASTRWRRFVAAERERLRYEATRWGKRFDNFAADRSIFSRIMQSIEDDILEILVTSLQRDGWVISTLIFDGCHVLHRPDASLEEALARAMVRITKETGFEIELVEKPLFGKHEDAVELSRI